METEGEKWEGEILVRRMQWARRFGLKRIQEEIASDCRWLAFTTAHQEAKMQGGGRREKVKNATRRPGLA